MDYNELYAPAQLMVVGCSDGGCLFIKTPEGGMKTNGGCQCEKRLRYTSEGISAIFTIRILRSRLQQRLMMDEPLSTESASALLKSLGYDPMLDGNMLKILRAVEQAHGIQDVPDEL